MDLKCQKENTLEEANEIISAVIHILNTLESYPRQTATVKRIIISKFFSEKWVFDGEKHLFKSIATPLDIMLKINEMLRNNKGCAHEKVRDLHSLVPPIGFEPMTYGLENRCSIQLSYGGIINKMINHSI